MNQQPKYSAIVLAADRGTNDPVAKTTNSPCKALSPVAGTAMLARVLDALNNSPWINQIIIVGPAQHIVDTQPQLATLLNTPNTRWIPNGSSPCTSAMLASAEIPDDQPFLITTADHALLNCAILDEFCSAASASPADAILALADANLVESSYSEVHRTKWKFKELNYCSCNLFAFRTRSSHKLIEFWKQMEDHRKNPITIVSKVGWLTVTRFALKQLSLSKALQSISQRLSITIDYALLSIPEAAIDVDSAADLKLVEKILRSRGLTEPTEK